MKTAFLSKKIRLALISISTILLLYSLLGFLVFPAVVLNQAPELAQEKLSRPLIIQHMQFNPFSMELNIQGFELKNPDQSPFISFKGLYVNLAVLQSIFDLSLILDEIRLTQPSGLIQRNKQGDFNFSDLLPTDSPAPEEKPDTEIFPVSITQLKLINGKVSWTDDFYSTKQHDTIFPLNLNIANFTTKTNKASQLGFSLQFASGGQFDWKGTLQLNPLLSQGNIKLANLNFHKLWALFLQDYVNFEILSGTELLEAQYRLTQANQTVQLILKDAALNFSDLKLAEKGNQQPLISIPHFGISGITVNLKDKSINIDKISASNAQFKTWLNADGSINYQALFTPKNQASAKNKASNPQQNSKPENENTPWQLFVKQLALNNFTLGFTDKTLPIPAFINISALNLGVSNISNQQGATLPFNLSLKLQETGQLKIQGQTVAEPLNSRFKLTADKIAIKDLQPYINKFARLDIISGFFNAQTTIEIQKRPDSDLALRLTGNSQINNLVTRDQISHKYFLNWKNLSLKQIDVDLQANKYIIDSVKIIRPYARVLIRKDKTMNVSEIVISNAKPDNKQTENISTEKKNEPLRFKIGQINMLEGESDFSDLSLILPFSVHMKKLKGSVVGLSSKKNAITKMALDGRVGGLSPVKIRGKMEPARLYSEISLDFKSMSLPLVTPYMAEFAGRKIEKGNISLKLNYQIKNKQLTASNNLLIEQLELGSEVKNPDAVSLPLDLAIALLEDTDGKIKLDVPIKGSLENPDFSIAGIIADALVNVITKVISSPFKAIASLIGSDQDISKISFSAGLAQLDDAQQQKLNGLAKALKNRPGLKLEIKGAAYIQLDWPKLQLEALKKQLIEIRAREINQNNDKKVLAEHITLSEEDYQRLLADLFIQKFPQLAERSLFGTPRLIEPTKGDFYQLAQKKLAETIPPDPQRLQKLAVSRAQAIAKYLMDQGIAIERLYLLDTAIDPQETEGTLVSSLNLTVN